MRSFARFSGCLGLPTEGFEEEILHLLRGMNDKKSQQERGLVLESRNPKGSLFYREMRRLEWNVKESLSKRGLGGEKGCL